MVHRIAILIVACCVVVASLSAQEPGKAAGKGTIERILSSGDSEHVAFSPRYSLAYSEGTGSKKSTWIVLTEKEPPLKSWAAASDRAEARQLWCQSEKTPFVAVKLDAEWKVDLYFLCPANGSVNTEMVNTANGLDSVVVKFAVRDEKRLKGTLRTGQGSCPGPVEGTAVYCDPTGDYTFDALFLKH